jgi:hypothetical protein
MCRIRPVRRLFESLSVQQISRNEAFDSSDLEWPPGQPDDIPISLSAEQLGEVTSDNAGHSNNQRSFLLFRFHAIKRC